MACQRDKNLEKCVASGRVMTGEKAHYYSLYLWDDKHSLNNCRVDYNNNREPHEDDGIGLCCHMPYWIRKSCSQEHWSPKLGEMHFIVDEWNMEIVAHECEHAKVHICRMMHINPLDGIEDEETAAYILGRLVSRVYMWLWEHNPAKSYRESG